MEAIEKLEKLNYVFFLSNEGKISYKYTKEDEPDPEKVDPLFEQLKTGKQEALAYLYTRATEQVDANKPDYDQLFCQTYAKIRREIGDNFKEFTLWLQECLPELAEQIDQSEERINVFWGIDLNEFKAVLKRYHDLYMQAIRQYKHAK